MPFLLSIWLILVLNTRPDSSDSSDNSLITAHGPHFRVTWGMVRIDKLELRV